MQSKYILAFFSISILLILAIIIVIMIKNSQSQVLPIRGNEQLISVVPEPGITLSARYYASPGKVENRAVVLLHMLGSNQNAWNTAAANLQEQNYEVLTLDFRGHGDSTGNWHKFKESDFAKFKGDVQEALKYLYDINERMEIVIIGASIGANVGLQVAAEDSRVIGVVALSPSFDYKGITTAESNAKLTMPVLYIVADEDQPAATATKELAASGNSAQHTLVNYSGADHGTNLLTTQPDVFTKIADWLTQL